MEDKMIELLNQIKELKNELNIENNDGTHIKCMAVQNTETVLSILDNISNGDTAYEALNKDIRTYEDALAKCLEAGASANEEFTREFTSHYLCNILGILAYLCISKDFTKNRNNIDFLKDKAKECLKYMDRL